jgi:hypothetical protein
MGKNKRDFWHEDLRYATTMGDRIVLWLDNTHAWFDIAEGFHDSAQATVHTYLKNPDGKVDPVPAIGFLYRHSIELLLKSIVIVQKRADREPEKFLVSHDLEHLWKEAIVAVDKIFPGETTMEERDRLGTCIARLSQWDPDATYFRYPSLRQTTCSRESSQTRPELRELIWICERLHRWLRRVCEGMRDASDMQEECPQDP